MLFSKSYSDTAVDRAAHWIRFLDNLQFLLTEVQEAEHQDVLIQFYQNQHLGMFNRKKIESAKRFLLFQNGIFLKVLEHMFDGSQSDFKKFEKESILKAGNYGFGANEGKTLYKGYLKSKTQFSKYKNSGIEWAEEFYIPTIIDQGLSIEDIEEYVNNPFEDEIDEEHEYELDDLEEEEEEEEDWGDDNKQLIKLFANAHLDEKKRYKIYQTYFEAELREYSDIYNAETLKKLDDIRHRFGAKSDKENKTDFNEVAQSFLKYEWGEKSPKRLFNAFELLSEIMKSQKIKTKFNFNVPQSPDDGSNKLTYIPVNFFSLRDQIVATEKFSFEFLDLDYPEFGKPYSMYSYPFRIPMTGNMYLFPTMTLKLGEKSYVLAKANIALSLGEFDEIKSKASDFAEAKCQQGMVINYGLENWDSNNLGQDYKETVEEYIKKAEERDKVFGRKVAPKIKKIIKDNKNVSESKKEKVLRAMSQFKFEVSASSMDYYEPEDLFNLQTISEAERRDHYDECGSFFDSFECEILEKLLDLGMPLNIEALKSGYGWLPNIVMEILVIERFFHAISGKSLDYDSDEIMGIITPSNLMYLGDLDL